MPITLLNQLNQSIQQLNETIEFKKKEDKKIILLEHLCPSLDTLHKILSCSINVGTAFSKEEDEIELLKSILKPLNGLTNLKKIGKIRMDIEEMRRTLISCLSSNFMIYHFSIAKKAYDILLILAKIAPKNDKDIFTLENFRKEDIPKTIYISTGHRFILSDLIQANNIRPYRNLEKPPYGKKLINPITNIPFNIWDTLHIQDKVKKTPGLEIEMFLPNTYTYEGVSFNTSNPLRRRTFGRAIVYCFFSCFCPNLNEEESNHINLRNYP